MNLLRLSAAVATICLGLNAGFADAQTQTSASPSPLANVKRGTQSVLAPVYLRDANGNLALAYVPLSRARYMGVRLAAPAPRHVGTLAAPVDLTIWEQGN